MFYDTVSAALDIMNLYLHIFAHQLSLKKCNLTSNCFLEILIKDLKASNLHFLTRFRVVFFENGHWFIMGIFFLHSRIVYFGFNELLRYTVELIQLLESNILGILPEALTAHIQVVLADQSMSVRAGTALAWALAVFPGPGVPHSFKTHSVKIIFTVMISEAQW